MSLISLVAPVVEAHTVSQPASAKKYPVQGRPTISAKFIDLVLSSYNSPATGKGQALYDDGVAYGIDPVFALAFFLQESTFGTAGIAAKTHSLGNIRCTSDDHSCYHGYRYYKTWEDSFKDWYRLINDVYINSWNLVTVEQIIPRYAPSTDRNDVKTYIKIVKQAVEHWRAGGTFAAATSSSSSISSSLNGSKGPDVLSGNPVDSNSSNSSPQRYELRLVH